MSESVRAVYQHLREAAAQCTLAELCHRQELDLLLVFGSVIFDSEEPRDLDVAIRFAPDSGAYDTLKILDDLYRLTGSERIDLMVLNRAGPLARERALTTGEPLFQLKQGDFAVAQIAAIMESLETDRFRTLDLERLSS